ncbi:hypothetical protein L218DRAFT_992937 [Marasmius fiardii PR-910]|nr:hypothetical protein L218DRAFT_992937 [Marasmius fiardii PR-910]
MSISSRHVNTETLDPARRTLFNTFVGLTSERQFTGLWQIDVEFNKRILAPQAELGLLSEHDAVVVAQTLSATTRASYTNLPNSVLSGLLAHLTCNVVSRWTRISPLSRSLMVSLSTASSYWVQETILPALIRKNLVSRVENPEGVNQALQNIRYREDVPASDSFATVSLPPSLPLPAPAEPPAPKPLNQNHWDEIRKTNSNKASPSTWDQLRQRHEKSDMEPNSNPQTQKDDDRARAQAKFDALVDRERNMK